MVKPTHVDVWLLIGRVRRRENSDDGAAVEDRGNGAFLDAVLHGGAVEPSFSHDPAHTRVVEDGYNQLF